MKFMLKPIKHLLLWKVSVCLLLLMLSVSVSGQSGFINLDISIEQPTDCVVKDGKIVITPLNGTAPYQYSIDGGATFFSKSEFSNLSIGSYIVNVKDANNEISSFKFVQLFTEDSPRLNGVAIHHPAKCGEGGALNIIATGGHGPLIYSIDGGVSFHLNSRFDNLGAGIYNVIVANTDQTCLTFYPPINYQPVEPSRFISGSTNIFAPTCKEENGQIEVIVGGNLNDFEFSIDRGISFQKSNIFSGLPAGNYSVIARNLDLNCQKEIDVVNLTATPCPLLPCDQLIENTIFNVPGCDEAMEYCINIPLTAIGEYTININGQRFDPAILLACRKDNTLAAFLLMPGTHFINIVKNDGTCTTTATVQVNCEFDGSQDCNFINDESVSVSTPTERYSYCLNIPLSNFSDYEVLVNGFAAEGLHACNRDTTLAAIYLLKGNHTISIARTGRCQDQSNVRVSCAYDPTSPEYCGALLQDQRIALDIHSDTKDYCLNFPISEIDKFTIRVNGFTPIQPVVPCVDDPSLAALRFERGTYQIELYHENGICSDSATVQFYTPYQPENPEYCAGLIEDRVLDLEQYGEEIYYCLDIPLEHIGDFEINVNGAPFTQQLLACREDPTLAALLFEKGTYQISIRHKNGICNDDATLRVTCPFDPDDPVYCASIVENTIVELNEVGGTIPICLNLPVVAVPDYEITINGQPPTQQLAVCSRDNQLAAYIFSEGTYQIVVRHIDGTCVDEATFRVDNPFDPEDPEFCSRLISDAVFEVADSTATVPFCLNIPIDQLPNFVIIVNDIDVSLEAITCDNGGALAAINLGFGQNDVRIVHENNICKDQAIVLVTTPMEFDPLDSLTCNNLIGDSVFELGEESDTHPFCLNIPMMDAVDFVVTVNGQVMAVESCESNMMLAGIRLPEGTHDVELNHNNGTCRDQATIRIVDEYRPDDSTFCTTLIDNGAFILVDSGGVLNYCLSIPESDISNFTITILKEGVAYAPEMTTCASESSSIALALSAGLYEIYLNHDNGICNDSAMVVVENPEPEPLPLDDCLGILREGDIVDIRDCDSTSTTDYCLEIPANGQLQLSLNGTVVNDFISCSSATALGIALSPGMHTLVLSSDSTGCVDTANIMVRCFPETLANFTDTVFFNETSIYCIDDSLLEGGIDTMYNACPEKSGNIVNFLVEDGSTCIVFDSGDQIGVEEACIIICNEAGKCGTIFMTVTVLPEPIVTFSDTILLNQTDTFCIDTDMLDGTIVSITNTCPEESGEAVQFVILDSIYCVSYTGLEVGTEKACIRVCDDNDQCFTTEITILSQEKTIPFRDTVGLNETDTFCIDTSQLAGTIVSIMNTCPEEGGEAVLFEILDSIYCVSYTGLEVGTEKACIRVCDDNGECFITEITIVSEDERLSFEETIVVDSSGVFCPDTTLLAGNIVSITNTCPEEAGEFVAFTIDSLNCVHYEGLMVGTGKACIEICDDMEECVTIDVTIHVAEDTLKAPIAVPDMDTVKQAQMVVLNPLSNDTLCSDSIVVTIAAMPANGTVMVNPDGTITYIPMTEFCDDEDVFMYQICNETGCDTARVMLFVECSVIEIFPAFSPNGDGINDVFTIDGLEGFPNHVLQVFDRRGTRVLYARPYENDWDGTWDGKDLPDGIYFYTLDDGAGGMFSGYLNLRR